ncbi:nucleotide exchange factor GrpE [Spiroplasma endosymbiont of Melieria omissa]|uniref:nucleotide exchange factor GrpE n=1 Tax=Spiroplasma endosymbiont of Melieria omissa TaxID=3139324 RepID=UPI003CCAE427
MAIIDKTKSQTYNFLSENKSIEDIKKQPNTTLKEKSRHGGSTFKIIEKITASEQQLNDDLSKNINENLKIVSTNLTDNEKEQKTNNDFWTKLTNYLNLPKPNTEELIQAQRKIQELEKEIQQLKKEYEELKLKQGNVNLAKFKYNAITIYNEKQTKKTGIDKIHEEFLPIADKIFFITTFVHINQSISEEIMYFHHFKYDASLKIIKQTKYS